jgi:hypothetical protein
MGTSSVGSALKLGRVVILMMVGLAPNGCGRGRATTAVASVDAAPAAGQLAAQKIPADAGAPVATDFRACPGAIPGATTRVKNIHDCVQVAIKAKV